MAAVNLADRAREKTTKAKVPPSWETPSGGPTALLRAAREADDTGLKEIVAQARKVGLKGMDVNVVDSSGRVSGNFLNDLISTVITVASHNASYGIASRRPLCR